MDKDRVKGKMDEVAGRVKRQAGEWTGDTEAKVEGGAQELKGKVQNAWGKAKDAVRESGKPKGPGDERAEDDLDQDRKKDVA